MKRASYLILSVAAIIGLFFLAASFVDTKKKETFTRIAKEKLVKDYSPKLGPENAKVTVVEFLDPECESCAAFYPKVKGVVDDYKTQVQFVVRYMLFHGNSKLAAQANEAAGKQGKYWEMQGQLFYRAKEWTHQSSPQTEMFAKFAADIGLDVEKFKKDMTDPQVIANIENDFKEGPGVGVTGTPTLFVNGRMLDQLSYDSLKALIEEELKN